MPTPTSPYDKLAYQWTRLTYAPQYLVNKISRANLFRFLREIGVLGDNNVPSTEMIEQQLFDYDITQGRGPRGMATYYVPFASKAGLRFIDDQIFLAKRES